MTMQVTHFMDEATFDQRSMDVKQPLRVVIAYNDLPAGKHAMRVMVNLGKELGDDIEFQPFPWSFDLLSDVDWREVAASDAVKADMLIIATSDRDPLPPAVGRWAETAISGKRGTTAAVVALFGPEGNPDRAGSSRLQAIQTAALRAGLDFFAPAPRRELDEAMARIHQRAEMITPILQEILQQHEPVLHRQYRA